MAKHKKSASKSTSAAPQRGKGTSVKAAAPTAAGPLGNKDYEKALKQLHVELVQLQEWVQHAGLKVCVIFEGRDGAGKGGTIKAITERVSPRVFRVVALPAPTDREKSQMYIQRYMPPSARRGRGRDLRPQLVQPGRRRARDGLLHRRAGQEVPAGRAAGRKGDRRIRHHPHQVLARGEQPTNRRAGSKHASTTDARSGSCRRWISKSYSRWYDYSRARDEMFAATDTSWAPWYVVRSDDKKKARLNVIRHLLGRVPHEKVKRPKVKLPKRQKAGNYREPDYPYKFVPEKH